MSGVRSTKDQHRRAALYLLRRGVLTTGEIARVLGESRQLVHIWASESGFDWRQKRSHYVQRWTRRALISRRD